jgi:hypothetical protein
VSADPPPQASSPSELEIYLVNGLFRVVSVGDQSLVATFATLPAAREAYPEATVTPTVGAAAPAPRWYLPLLWILLIPIVTGPVTNFLKDRVIYHSGLCSVTPGFFGAYASCSTVVLLLLLSPGLLNLVPLWWLRSTHPKLRAAALWATVLGALRLIVPAIAVIASPDDNTVSAAPGVFGPSGFVLSILVISLALWFATFPVIWIVGRRHR